MVRVSKAVAEVFSLSGEPLGTAFAVTKEKGLSSFHCFGDRQSGALLAPRVRLSFGQEATIEAQVTQFDRCLDVALLDFSGPLPEIVTPMPLAVRVARHARFAIMGWPTIRPFDNDASAVSGRIIGTDITIFDGTPAIQLYCEQAIGGISLDGFSGSPIIVGTTSGEAVIGIVRCSPEPGSQGGQAEGGTVYATPTDAILRLWPELALCQVSAVPVGPADYGISYCTSSADVDWGLWIAQILDDLGMTVFTRRWYLRPGDDYVEVLRAGFASVRQIFVLVSSDYAVDRDDLHLVERRVIAEHPYAKRIPVMIEDVEVPEYLRRLHPLRLHGDLADETKCKDLLLETVEPLGRPASKRPFPGAPAQAMQERPTNWLNRIETTRPNAWESSGT